MLQSWFRLLQHQGINMDAFAEVVLPLRLRNPSNPDYLQAIGRGYEILEHIQADPEKFPTMPGSAPSGEFDSPTDWPYFQANEQQTGNSPDPGPSHGRVSWKFPIGHAWYARPSIDDGRVYVTSPSITTVLYCLDERNGNVIWKTHQYGPSRYGAARVSASPVVLDDAVLLRGSGQFDRGDQYPTALVWYVDKKTGRLRRSVRVGHVDYRRVYPSFAADERYLVALFGEQQIGNSPPLVWNLDTVVVKDGADGEQRWSLRVGDVFGEPLIDGDQVLVGTDDGVLFCLNLEGPERIAWQFRANQPLRGTPTVEDGRVYVSANDGSVHALERNTGKLLWTLSIDEVEPRAFRLLSDVSAVDGRLYFGGANRLLYCVDAATGRLLWKHEVSDWIRAKPVVVEDTVYAAAMDGTVYALRAASETPKVLWEKDITTHQVLADLAGNENGIIVASNDLYVVSLNPKDGSEQWRQSAIEAASINGKRVEADIIAGGADYQSSPTAANGKVFIGSPNRFVYSVDADTGKEIWRFEASGQVSGTPAVAEGRVYFGQQGGNREFYAVSAEDGSLIWKKDIGWAWVGASYSDGMLYFGTVEGEVVCLRASDGKFVWKHRTNGGVYPAAPRDEHNVYTGSWDGYYFALDKKTGKLRWAYDLGGKPDSGAPVLWKGKLHALALRRHLVALNAETGREVWKYPIAPGRNLNGSSSAYGDRIFMSHYIDLDSTPLGATVVALDDATGEVIWEHPVGGGLTAPVVARDKVCFGSTNHTYFTCVDREGNGDGTTRMLWRYRMDGTVDETCPAIYGTRLFVLATDRYLYAFE